jgi:hypothetical protein
MVGRGCPQQWHLDSRHLKPKNYTSNDAVCFDFLETAAGSPKPGDGGQAALALELFRGLQRRLGVQGHVLGT